MRLNRYLALCGLGSRRAVEQIILDGRVSVNGDPTADLATQVEEARDTVEVDGVEMHPVSRRDFAYILLNKPKGYDVTRGGRHHHRRAWDLLPEGTHPSVQSVGRLDRNSTGLLLFTNDGELAYRLSHPRFGCRKVYEVEVDQEMPAEMQRQLREGVELEDGMARALSVERIPSEPDGYPRYRITMEEGRNRIVRRMCEAVGRPVANLNRSAFGPLTLADLPRGKTRPLTPWEVRQLKKLVSQAGLGEGAEAGEHAGRSEKPAPRPRPQGSRPGATGGSRPRVGGARPRPAGGTGGKWEKPEGRPGGAPGRGPARGGEARGGDPRGGAERREFHNKEERRPSWRERATGAHPEGGRGERPTEERRKPWEKRERAPEERTGRERDQEPRPRPARGAGHGHGQGHGRGPGHEYEERPGERTGGGRPPRFGQGGGRPGPGGRPSGRPGGGFGSGGGRGPGGGSRPGGSAGRPGGRKKER